MIKRLNVVFLSKVKTKTKLKAGAKITIGPMVVLQDCSIRPGQEADRHQCFKDLTVFWAFS